MEVTFGLVTAVGEPAQVALVDDAVTGAKNLPKPLADLPKRPYRVEFHTPAEFLARDFVIPGTDKAAWGYVAATRVLWINSSLRPWKARYTIVHEIAHALDSDYLDTAKKAELMALMNVSPRLWRGGDYANRPREIYADAFTEAVGIASPLDDFYGDITDANLPGLIAITFRPAPPPPVVEEPPDPPLPLPDPDLEKALGRISQLEKQLVGANALAAQMPGIVAGVIAATEVPAKP
jgi:hypothetical protein